MLTKAVIFVLLLNITPIKANPCIDRQQETIVEVRSGRLTIYPKMKIQYIFKFKEGPDTPEIKTCKISTKKVI